MVLHDDDDVDDDVDDQKMTKWLSDDDQMITAP